MAEGASADWVFDLFGVAVQPAGSLPDSCSVSKPVASAEFSKFPDVQAGFRKSRGTTDQIANIHWIMEKARECQKNIYFCFIDYAKAFDCVDHINCGKFWKRWEYQTTWPASWEICM